MCDNEQSGCCFKWERAIRKLCSSMWLCGLLARVMMEGSASGKLLTVELSAADLPGLQLNEPFESHGVPAWPEVLATVLRHQGPSSYKKVANLQVGLLLVCERLKEYDRISCLLQILIFGGICRSYSRQCLWLGRHCVLLYSFSLYTSSSSTWRLASSFSTSLGCRCLDIVAPLQYIGMAFRGLA